MNQLMSLEIGNRTAQNMDVFTSISDYEIALSVDNSSDSPGLVAVINGLSSASERSAADGTQAFLLFQHLVIVICGNPELLAAMSLVVSPAFRMFQFCEFTTPPTLTLAADTTSAR
jgi:hypothetical protein